jgi:MFS family permease
MKLNDQTSLPYVAFMVKGTEHFLCNSSHLPQTLVLQMIISKLGTTQDILPQALVSHNSSRGKNHHKWYTSTHRLSFLWGMFADKWGRRPALLFGLAGTISHLENYV